MSQVLRYRFLIWLRYYFIEPQGGKTAESRICSPLVILITESIGVLHNPVYNRIHSQVFASFLGFDPFVPVNFLSLNF